MSDFEKTLVKIREFRDARDWMQFHNTKDMAIAISVEASELLEHFLWKTPQECEQRVRAKRTEITDEIADIAIYLFELADNLDINLPRAMSSKMRKNGKKYPVSKAKGIAMKYSEMK